MARSEWREPMWHSLCHIKDGEIEYELDHRGEKLRFVQQLVASFPVDVISGTFQGLSSELHNLESRMRSVHHKKFECFLFRFAGSGTMQIWGCRSPRPMDLSRMAKADLPPASAR